MSNTEDSVSNSKLAHGRKLTFECCGHSFTIRGESGNHTDHCLHCDTANPPVSMERWSE